MKWLLWEGQGSCESVMAEIVQLCHCLTLPDSDCSQPPFWYLLFYGQYFPGQKEVPEASLSNCETRKSPSGLCWIGGWSLITVWSWWISGKPWGAPVIFPEPQRRTRSLLLSVLSNFQMFISSPHSNKMKAHCQETVWDGSEIQEGTHEVPWRLFRQALIYFSIKRHLISYQS